MAAVSKEEYLKRYLSGKNNSDKDKKRKKKLKIKAVVPKSRIIDDDVDMQKIETGNLENTLEEDIGDDGPTVAEVVDERSEEAIAEEQYRRDKRWKVMVANDKSNTNQHTAENLGSRHSRKNSESDQSPPQRKQHDSDSDQTPPRRKRHDSESDQSPPRKQRHDSDSDQSPTRRQRHDSDSNQSPPRRKRHASDSDQSPPRRKKHASDSDQSPPRRKKQNSDSDQSPPRRKRHASDSDQSPPRKRTPSIRSSHGSVKPDVDKDDQGRAKKTLSGATAGLQSAKAMREEAKKMRKREEDMFKKIGSDALGVGAETVFRSKETGRKRNLKEEQKETEAEQAKKAVQAEQYAKWGKGLKQIAVQQEAVQDAIHEIQKPFTRDRDDLDLDDLLRAKDRDGDPMLAYIKKKTTEKKANALPRYKGHEPAPNRFNIWPGYRWDGVDRSNGFEKRYFASLSDKKALKEMAYKWSVEDM